MKYKVLKRELASILQSGTDSKRLAKVTTMAVEQPANSQTSQFSWDIDQMKPLSATVVLSLFTPSFRRSTASSGRTIKYLRHGFKRWRCHCNLAQSIRPTMAVEQPANSQTSQFSFSFFQSRFFLRYLFYTKFADYSRKSFCLSSPCFHSPCRSNNTHFNVTSITQHSEKLWSTISTRERHSFTSLSRDVWFYLHT